MADPGLTERALLSWTQSKAAELQIAVPQTLKSLSSGVTISQILASVSPDAFSSCIISASNDSPASFMATVRNLKKLYKSLASFEPELSGTAEPPNMSLIAKDADTIELVKLLRLVFGTAVKHEQSDESIERVGEQAERELLRSLVRDSTGKDLGSSESVKEKTGEQDAESARVKAEVDRVVSRYAALEQAYTDLESHNSSLEERFEKLKLENADLKATIETQSSKSKMQAELADSQTKAQIEYLQKDVQQLEEQIGLRDKKLAVADARLKEMNDQVEEVHADLQGMVEVKDMLDEAHHEIEQLRKANAQMERYRKQADLAEDLQRQVTVLKNENTYLTEKSKLLDEDTQQVFGLRKQVEILQSETEFYRRKAREAENLSDKLRDELATVRERTLVLEEDHSRDAAMIVILEEKVRTLEGTTQFAGGSTLRDAQEKDYDLTIEDLKQENEKLREEVLSLRALQRADEKLESERPVLDNYSATAQATESAARNKELEEALKNAVQIKDKLEEDYMQVYQEKTALQARLEAVENAVVAADTSDITTELRKSLNETEDKLRDTNAELDELQKRHSAIEEKYQQTALDLTLVNKDKKEILAALKNQANRSLLALQSEFEKALAQKSDLEAEISRLQELLTKALLDKDALHEKLTTCNEELLEVSRANTTLRMSLVSLDPNATSSGSELKSWVIDLQKKLEVQREKMRKAQEFIRKLKVDNEVLRRPSGVMHKPSLTPEEAEIMKRELHLMTSAWYSLSSRIQQNKVVVVRKTDEAPASWLNRQRKLLEERR